MYYIPLDTRSPVSTRTLLLDGSDYILETRWNSRSGWYLGLSDYAEDPLFKPRKLVVSYDLLKCVRHDTRCPPGKLYAVDYTGGFQDPGSDDLCSGPDMDDLRGRVLLVYVPQSEL
jgi:hypothetical protein